MITVIMKMVMIITVVTMTVVIITMTINVIGIIMILIIIYVYCHSVRTYEHDLTTSKVIKKGIGTVIKLFYFFYLALAGRHIV